MRVRRRARRRTRTRTRVDPGIRPAPSQDNIEAWMRLLADARAVDDARQIPHWRTHALVPIAREVYVEKVLPKAEKQSLRIDEILAHCKDALLELGRSANAASVKRHAEQWDREECDKQAGKLHVPHIFKSLQRTPPNAIGVNLLPTWSVWRLLRNELFGSMDSPEKLLKRKYGNQMNIDLREKHLKLDVPLLRNESLANAVRVRAPPLVRALPSLWTSAGVSEHLQRALLTLLNRSHMLSAASVGKNFNIDDRTLLDAEHACLKQIVTKRRWSPRCQAGRSLDEYLAFASFLRDHGFKFVRGSSSSGLHTASASRGNAGSLSKSESVASASRATAESLSRSESVALAAGHPSDAAPPETSEPLAVQSESDSCSGDEAADVGAKTRPSDEQAASDGESRALDNQMYHSSGRRRPEKALDFGLDVDGNAKPYEHFFLRDPTDPAASDLMEGPAFSWEMQQRHPIGTDTLAALNFDDIQPSARSLARSDSATSAPSVYNFAVGARAKRQRANGDALPHSSPITPQSRSDKRARRVLHAGAAEEFAGRAASGSRIAQENPLDSGVNVGGNEQSLERDSLRHTADPADSDSLGWPTLNWGLKQLHDAADDPVESDSFAEHDFYGIQQPSQLLARNDSATAVSSVSVVPVAVGGAVAAVGLILLLAAVVIRFRRRRTAAGWIRADPL